LHKYYLILKKYSVFVFNTTAQVGTSSKTPQNSTTQNKGKPNSIQKRARSKFLSNSIVNELYKLDSPLKSSYGRSIKCCDSLNVENGTVYGKYCKNRYCLVCARIKTAVLCEKYKEPIKQNFNDPYFVTLTVPNVRGIALSMKIKEMFKDFKKLQEKHKKRHQRGQINTKMKAIVKLECTYNQEREDFHPHLHIITNTLETANFILEEWLQRNKKSKRIAQDVRKADENSIMELFKYSTKLMSDIKDYESGKALGKGNIVVEAMDVMFRAMHKKRTLRTYGFRLEIKEEFSEEDLKAYTVTEVVEGEYQFNVSDWVEKIEGELLADWQPGHREKKFKESIKSIGKKFLPKYSNTSVIIDLLESYRLQCGFSSHKYLTGYLLINDQELRIFEDTAYGELKIRGFDDTQEEFASKLHKYLDKFSNKIG
jgi:hypothetical protein